MKVIKRLKKQLKAGKQGVFRKKNKSFQKYYERFVSFFNSEDTTEEEQTTFVMTFLSLVKNFNSDPLQTFKILEKVPLFVLLFKDLVATSAVPVEEKRPYRCESLVLFLLISMLPKKVRETVFQHDSFVRYIQNGQREMLKMFTPGEFARKAISTIVTFTQILTAKKPEAVVQYYVQLSVQWVDAALSLDVKETCKCLQDWTLHVIDLAQQKRPKKAGDGGQGLHMDSVCEFYVTVMRRIIVLENPENQKAERYLLDFLQAVSLDRTVKNKRHRMFAVEILGRIFGAAFDKRLFPFLFDNLLWKETKSDIRVRALDVCSRIVSEMATMRNQSQDYGQRTDLERKLLRYLNSLIKVAYFDPAGSVRFRAVKLILSEFSTASFRPLFPSYTDFLLKKARDTDARTRLSTLQHIVQSKVFSESLEQMFLLVKQNILDKNKSIQQISKSILLDEIMTQKEPLEVIRSLTIDQLLSVKDVLKFYIEDIVKKMETDENEMDESEDVPPPKKKDVEKDILEFTSDDFFR